MTVKAPCIYLCVAAFKCVSVFMQRCLWLQQDLLPSFTLLVCAVLLQPGAEHSCSVRPVANITDCLAEPLNAERRTLCLDKKREVGRKRRAGKALF